jgi:hypothetical protein
VQSRDGITTGKKWESIYPAFNGRTIRSDPYKNWKYQKIYVPVRPVAYGRFIAADRHSVDHALINDRLLILYAGYLCSMDLCSAPAAVKLSSVTISTTTSPAPDTCSVIPTIVVFHSHLLSIRTMQRVPMLC